MEKRVIAGFLLFFGFIISIVTVIALMLEYEANQGTIYEGIYSDNRAFAIIQGVAAVVILLGAMSAIAGRLWGLAMVGAVVCLLSGGFYFLGSACGLVALIMLIMWRDEFKAQVVYVDEGAYGYGETYYEGGEYAEEGWSEYSEPTQYQEAPAMQLVDQYGGVEEHPYDGQQPR